MSESEFLKRWSARKRAQEPEEVAPEEEAPPPEPAEEKTDEEILAEHDLPDPDTLEPGSDFAAFLKPTIPQHLQNRALRKLWTSNPVLANLDGLVEYGEDFTKAASVTDFQTAYRVGRGFLKALAEEEAPASPAEEPAPEPVEIEDEVVAEEVPEAVGVPEPDAQPEPQPVPRRMAFRFEDK